MLLKKVGRILESRNWSWAECQGHSCFDVAARKRSVMLLKVLENVDSFMPQQAKNLKILSENLDATAALVGERTRYEALEDSVVYERFEVPTFTAETLEAILDTNLPETFRSRGGLFAEVIPEKLRAARKRAGLTQAELARRVGITKKAVYEHEARRMRMRQEIAARIESVLGDEISAPFALKALDAKETNYPRNAFEMRVSRTLRAIGFDTEIVYQSPFNIIARERVVILSDAEPAQRVRRKAGALAEIAEVTKKPALAITDKPARLDIPAIDRKSLRELSARDLRKLAK